MVERDFRFHAGVLRALVRATGHGFDGRVFPHEHAAERWLHSGAA